MNSDNVYSRQSNFAARCAAILTGACFGGGGATGACGEVGL
jgi:hypothetical protein